MEMRELPKVVLMFVLVGLLIGVGVLTLNSFSDAVKQSTPLTEQLTVTSGATTLSFDELVSNAVTISNASGFGCTTPNICANVSTESGAVSLNASFKNGPYNFSYTYYADTSSSTTADSSISALSPIATTWIPLIVTVVVLAIIIVIVVRSFSFGATKR